MTAARALAVFALAAGAPTPVAGQANAPAGLASARQLLLVTARGWDDTTAVLRRYERPTPDVTWRAVGDAVPVVLGRTGLAWGVGQGTVPAGAPRKREGDGRSPAGVYPLMHGFAFPANVHTFAPGVPVVALDSTTACVDDAASRLYNAVVDAGGAGGARWTSAERMRLVAGYRLGLVVGYNGAWTRAGGVDEDPVGGRRAVRGGGSCIFVHVWDGPARPTAGCTAMAEPALAAVVAWVDPARRPVLVQLPRGELARRRVRWALP